MTETALKKIDPNEARVLIENGATVVDIRGPDEFAREHIKGAHNEPVDAIGGKLGIPTDDRPVVFHCKSGMRTQAHAGKLAGAVECEAYLIEGGLEAWKKAGLPTETDTSQPMEIQRQVQITAGGLVVLGVVLGALVSPWFYALSGFIGAGLVYAGVSGTCGMAKALSIMPWNRQATA